MKECLDCHRPLPLRAFYRHPQMADGRLNKCKECVKARIYRHRQANLAKVQAYDRKRGLLLHRKEANRRRASTSAARKRHVILARAWAEQNLIKTAAHIIVGNAIRDSKLIRGSCERCGTNKYVHAHHEDYSKALEIMWLCRKHHGERHRELNDVRRTQQAA